MKLSYLNIIIIFTLAANTVPIIGGEKEVTVQLTLQPGVHCKHKSISSFVDSLTFCRNDYLDLGIPYPQEYPCYFVKKAMINDTDWTKRCPDGMPKIAITRQYRKENKSALIPGDSIEYQPLFPQFLGSSLVQQMQNDNNTFITTDANTKTPIKLILKLEKILPPIIHSSTFTKKQYFFYGATALGLIGFIIWLTNMHKNIPTLFALKTAT